MGRAALEATRSSLDGREPGVFKAVVHLMGGRFSLSTLSRERRREDRCRDPSEEACTVSASRTVPSMAYFGAAGFVSSGGSAAGWQASSAAASRVGIEGTPGL